MQESIWLQETRSPGFTTDSRQADVIVIGAGLTGLLTAWRLIRAGRSVIVLEARAVGEGTSGHTTGKITSQHMLIYDYLIGELGLEQARIYADANQWAVEEYQRLIRGAGIDCHLRGLTAHVYSDDRGDLLKKEHEAALRLGLPSALESVAISANPVLAFSGQAQFQPRAFLLGLARRIVEHGGAIAEETRVTDVTEDDERCQVETAAGMFQSQHVVFATLFPILDRSYFAMRLKPVQHFGMAFDAADRQFDGVFIGTEGLSFRYHEDALIVVGAPQQMGHLQHPYQQLEELARRRLSFGKERSRWSAHDLLSPDRVPFIGTYRPRAKRRFTATGFNAWGISHAMVAARIFADLIDGRESLWAEFYSPWRTEGLLGQVADQAKTAVQRLVQGAPRCPHMGCSLALNEDDQTYDCPCHGSRFDRDGRVLWGPALAAAKIDEQRSRGLGGRRRRTRSS